MSEEQDKEDVWTPSEEEGGCDDEDLGLEDDDGNPVEEDG